MALFSCNSSEKTPISKENMTKIIADLQMAEAKVSRLNLAQIDSAKFIFKGLEKDIFKKYNTDSVSFVKSYDIFAKDKQELWNIYDKAQLILEPAKAKTQKPI